MRVAILGAGPAGSALAILLTRLGADVTLFDDGRRPELRSGVAGPFHRPIPAWWPKSNRGVGT